MVLNASNRLLCIEEFSDSIFLCRRNLLLIALQISIWRDNACQFTSAASSASQQQTSAESMNVVRNRLPQ